MLALVLAITSLASCGETEDITKVNQQTILIFMPWSGNLYDAFQANLDSIESAIQKNKGLKNARVMLYISNSPQKSALSEIVYNEKTSKCERIHLKDYSGTDYTTAAGITEILNEVKHHAEALNYAMIIGCHGSGWTQKDAWEEYPQKNKKKISSTGAEEEDVPIELTTRFYGATNYKQYETDITDLAEGIANAGIKMQYILFDDCYMANVETAYELRNVTNFLLASTSEVMYFGMPYHTMWNSLCSGTPNYQGAVNAFATFYKAYSVGGKSAHYGTLSAIDCREMDKVADMMKQINAHDTTLKCNIDSLQYLDGFKPTLFFDFGNYLDSLCSDKLLLNKMKEELGTLIRSTQKTDTIFTALTLKGSSFIIPKTFSGITISDPSTHPVAKKGKNRTSWYQATH